MADTLRESLPKLPKKAEGPQWKPKQPKGVISQGSYETSRGKKVSWKAT